MRALEIYRRIGVAERARADGYPSSCPMDAYHIATMVDTPLARVL